MIEKYNGGIIPEPKEPGEFDDDLKSVASGASEKIEAAIDKLQFHDGLEEIWKVVRRTNKYIDETTPWILAKDDANKERLNTVLYNLADCIRIISILIKPFMESTTIKIWTQLGIDEGQGTTWEDTFDFGRIPTGIKVSRKEVLFPRLDVDEEVKALEKMGESQEEQEDEVIIEPKEQITIDDFSKLELRVAKVLKAEKHPDADRLLVLQLQVGNEIRQVVSGIAEYYKPEQLEGKSLILVANLKPVKLRGIESHGMILAAYNDKELVLGTIDRDIASGTEIG